MTPTMVNATIPVFAYMERPHKAIFAGMTFIGFDTINRRTRNLLDDVRVAVLFESLIVHRAVSELTVFRPVRIALTGRIAHSTNLATISFLLLCALVNQAYTKTYKEVKPISGWVMAHLGRMAIKQYKPKLKGLSPWQVQLPT